MERRSEGARTRPRPRSGYEALRLFAADDRARAPYLEALRVEYEAAYQEDELETMLRSAEERAAAARGFDDEAYLTALLASARACDASASWTRRSSALSACGTRPSIASCHA